MVVRSNDAERRLAFPGSGAGTLWPYMAAVQIFQSFLTYVTPQNASYWLSQIMGILCRTTQETKAVIVFEIGCRYSKDFLPYF